MSVGDVFAAITFLANHAVEEINFQREVSDKIKEITRELEWTRAFLKDAEDKQTGMSLKRKRINDVRDNSYSLEDEIEKYIFVMEKRRQQNWIIRYAGIFEFLVKRHQIRTSIDRLQKESEDIFKSVSKFETENLAETSQPQNEDLREQRRSYPFEEESSFVGLDNELKFLKDRLLDAEEKRRCCISVVGMGGLGKTTIARKVYKDVSLNFDCNAWVYISQKFTIEDVLTKIMKDITGRRDVQMKGEELRWQIITLLKGKRYLVVLDDVWNDQLWLNLSSVFPDDNRGSRLLLTTRIEGVAKYVDPRTTPHKLRFLDKEESWKLFCEKALLVPGEDPEVLLYLGRKITEKCGGLPLAIIVLGGLLSRKPKQAHWWEGVLKNISSELKDSSERCKDILAMSYYDLPFQMKPCFLYFALFPEDSMIPAKTLIRLWVAENLIDAEKNENLEDKAEKYLEEFISRSLVEVWYRAPSGELKLCRMHDLVRDLAIEEARKDNFLHTPVSQAESVNDARRLSIQSFVPQEIENFELYPNRLRSLFLRSATMSWLKELIPKLPLLRVLDIPFVNWDSMLPKEINQLIHLRYLRLGLQFSRRDGDGDRGSDGDRGGDGEGDGEGEGEGEAEGEGEGDGDGDGDMGSYLGWYSERSSLSPTLSDLKHLQTLDLRCQFVYMSHSIWSLCKLRHLLAEYLVIKGDVGDERIDKLKNLQTLHLKPGNWIDGGLENLSNLRDLRINGYFKGYHEVISKALNQLLELRVLKLMIYDFTFPQLPSLSHLQYLKIMTLSGPMKVFPNVFPPNLIKLKLEICGRIRFNDLLVTLQNLKELMYLELDPSPYGVNPIENETLIFSSDGFPKLEVLILETSGDTLNIEKGALRRLKCLEIRSSYHPGVTKHALKDIPVEFKFMECLRELELHRISSEAFAHLESGGKDWQKIEHIPVIYVESCDHHVIQKESQRNPMIRKYPDINWVPLVSQTHN